MARFILALSVALGLALSPQAWGQAAKKKRARPPVNENVPAPKDCPRKFEPFLERFETDFTFQVAVVRYPLAIAFMDEGVQIKDKLNKMQYTKPRQPWYPTPALQSLWELKKEVRTVSPTRRLVHFEQADPESYSVDFHFQKHGTCWRLVFMDDRAPY
ncbi:MAG: hypothetical protein ACT4P4_15125 [Betaproteobacteria bacterium]